MLLRIQELALLGDRLFTFAGLRLWNNLPLHLAYVILNTTFLEFRRLLRITAPSYCSLYSAIQISVYITYTF